MSESRPLDIRVAEKEEQLKKALEKAEHYREQLKQLQTKQRKEEQKQRTHNLIVCGAELASLYGKVLDKEEVLAVVNFLRSQKEAGIFEISKSEESKGEDQRTENEKQEFEESVWGNEPFNF